MINLKNNKGAITLYILVSLLFFIVAIVSVQTNLKTKEANVESEYQKIKASYEKDANEVYAMKNFQKETTIESLKNSGEEITGSKLTLIDDNEEQVVIPVGFKIASDSATTVKEGIVVVAPDESEFVWVPVKDINTMFGTSETGKKMGKLYEFNSDGTVSNLNWTENEEKVMNWMLDETDTLSYREPDYLSSVWGGDAIKDDDTKGIALLNSIVGIEGDITTEEGQKQILNTWNTQLQNEFDEMIKYVGENKGFYVARYETSLLDKTTEDGKTKKIAQSKKGKTSATPENESANTWYGLYQKEKEYSYDAGLTDVVGSNMIWGSQYDQMLIWMKNNEINVSESTPVEGAVYNQTTITGSQDNDNLNNIYDLLGNGYEWTLESFFVDCRIYRRGEFWI